MRSFCLLVFAVLFGSCAVVQKIDTVIDCQGICDRYRSCFDDQYDVSACASRCRKTASEDPDFRRKADVCNACINQRSCVAATFACGAECLSVVP